MNKIILFLFENGDNDDEAWVNGKYLLGDYYFNFESVVWTARAIDPEVVIEIYDVLDREAYRDIPFTKELPDNFAEIWPVQPNTEVLAHG